MEILAIIIILVIVLLIKWRRSPSSQIGYQQDHYQAEKTYHQDYFIPENPDKYAGDINDIFYKSGWERDFCKHLDQSVKIKSWEYEPFSITYYNYGSGKPRQYFPDFLVEFHSGDIILYEIKPSEEKDDPVNWAKWAAARQFVKERGWKFRILTEHDRNEGFRWI